jgi:hypothetical protein
MNNPCRLVRCVVMRSRVYGVGWMERSGVHKETIVWMLQEKLTPELCRNPGVKKV